ncbi:ABC transporter ATP-binding protein [Actinomyces qiguomingii]|uniref:ATP-binding cassette domain-containing protein n=1 Tax=Actinomyces qiguomingii TaxID=2057800 RepID=UPI000CA08D62|nr:ABC transporter ATP-binding protein [Actinomyces qiguomingii]
MIRINSLTHTYRGTTVPALDDVSVDIAEGSITGVLGPNGSGKTTLFHALVGYIGPASGAFIINGHEVSREQRIALGVYAGDNAYSAGVSVRSLLRLVSCRHTWDEGRFARLSDRFQLELGGSLGQRSQGERSLFVTAIALACGAPITMLDEPTDALDVPTRMALTEEIIRASTDAAEAGTPRTFLVASHLVSELESLIENVIVLSAGRVVRVDTAERLRAHALALVGRPEVIRRILEADAESRILSERQLGRLVRIVATGLTDACLDALVAADVQVQPLSFQDSFVSLIDHNMA